MQSLVEHRQYMNSNVANMTGNLQLLNAQFTDMNRIVGSMSGNMHDMAKPMKMLPFP